MHSRFGIFSAIALVAGASVCLLLPGLLPLWFLACVALIGTICWWQVCKWRVLGMALVGFGLAGLHVAHAMHAQLPADLEQQTVQVQGRVLGLPDVERRRTRFRLHVQAGPAPLLGKTLQLAWYDDYGSTHPGPRTRLHAGAVWRMHVKLRAPRGLRNPGGFDSERNALAYRIAAMGHIRGDDFEEIAPPTGIDAWRERMSMRIARAGAQPELRFMRALALGDTSGLTDVDWRVLRANGLTHLIAISGFHVGLAAGFFALCCRGIWWIRPELGRIWPRPLAAGAAAALGALCYTAVAGFALPTLRTALMILLLVAARWWRRHASTADALALATILLVALDPLALLTPGFWLSFAGVAWLIWCLPPTEGNLVRQLLSAQAVATIGLLPLTLLWFGQASLTGPLANLLAVPLWSLVIVPLSLLGLLLETAVAGAGAWVWQLSALLFRWTWPLFEWLAQTRFALWWPSQPHWSALVLAAIAAFWLLLPRPVAGKPLALLLCLPLAYPARDLPPPGQVDMVMVDVGQGLAVVVRTATHTLLYDMGPAVEDGFDAGERAVVPTLRALGVQRLDAAIVSHGDNDHAGGLAAVRAEYAMPLLLSPAGSGVPHTAPCAARTDWNWDGVRFRIVHPPPLFPYLRNESSCILRIETANGAALLMGDVGEVIERRLLREQPQMVRSDVIAVAHHGSGGSSDPEFVRATGAALALFATGHGNRFKHPHPHVVARWQTHGAQTANTASDGALWVRLGGESIGLRAERSADRRLWDAERRRAAAAGAKPVPVFPHAGQ